MNDLGRTDVTPFFKPEKTVKRAVRQKPPKRVTEPKTVAEERAAWYAAVTAKKLSLIHTDEEYALIVAGKKVEFQCHHIVTEQNCRKHGAPVYDARNGVPVTVKRHAAHHSRKAPILRSELPDEIYGFLAEYPKLVPSFNKTYGLELPDTTATAVVSSGGEQQ